MTITAVAVVLALLALGPHLLPQSRLSAGSGIALWSAALMLRAALSIALVLSIILLLPTTQLFSLLTHWCIHTVLPFMATHLGFDGHELGGAAVVVPALVLGVSLLSVAFGLWRGARAVGRWLQRSSLGPGPAESVIIADPDVVVAAAGLRAPQVVVSAGALLRLDDAELAAGLEHEWGHVRRRHRFIALLGEICCASARLIPGSPRAMAALRFHLERDADDYAVRRTGDRLALASAICKAAQNASPQGTGGPALAGLAGTGVPQRLRLLVEDPAAGESRPMTRAAQGLSAALVVAALVLAGATPTIASVGAEQTDGSTGAELACE